MMLEIVQLLVDCYDCAADLDDMDFLLASLKGATERVGSEPRYLLLGKTRLGCGQMRIGL